MNNMANRAKIRKIFYDIFLATGQYIICARTPVSDTGPKGPLVFLSVTYTFHGNCN